MAYLRINCTSSISGRTWKGYLFPDSAEMRKTMASLIAHYRKTYKDATYELEEVSEDQYNAERKAASAKPSRKKAPRNVGSGEQNPG